jgi:hypothetical protein
VREKSGSKVRNGSCSLFAFLTGLVRVGAWMARKRVAATGRFARESEAEETERLAAEAGRRVGAPRPKYCRVYARARFAEALPEISERLVREAKKGSVAHLKLLVQLTGLDQKQDVVPRKQKKPGKSLEVILMEQWERDAAARAEAAEVGVEPAVLDDEW